MLLASPDNPALWATPANFMAGTPEQVGAVTSAPMPQTVTAQDVPRNRFANVPGLTPEEWLAYSNQGATRNLPLAQDLVAAMSFLPELGLRMEVFSGGQPAAGQGPRVGSTRHDHGNAADVFFVDAATGRRLDWNNPDDVPIFQEIVRRASDAGVTGFGAGPGYMQPGSMHIGFGQPAVWGADGRRENAPGWLVDAAGNIVATASTQQQQGGQTMPQGLLSPTVSSMNTQEPSIWDALVGRLPEGVQPIARRTIGDADWRDRMAIALAGMSTRPNQAIIGTLQDRMESRSEDRRMNQTVAYLESIGRPDLAAAIAAGLPAGDAIGAALAPPPPPPAPIEVNGQLWDPVTRQVIADLRTAETPDPGYRTLTPEEAAAAGLPADGLWQEAPDGQFERVSGTEGATPTDPTELRREWNALPGVRAFEQRAASYNNIIASAQDPSPAGDVALIYNFMKMLDPGSTVMQGEIAMAQQAGGVDDQIIALYNQTVTGTQLTEEQRKDFLTRATQIYRQQEQGYDQLRRQYTETAQAQGLDPTATLTEFRVTPRGQTLPGASDTPRATPNRDKVVQPPPPAVLENETFRGFAERRGLTPQEYWESLSEQERQTLINGLVQ